MKGEERDRKREVHCKTYIHVHVQFRHGAKYFSKYLNTFQVLYKF